MNRVLALLSLLTVLGTVTQAQGPVGKLYVTDWLNFVNYVIQGPNVIQSAPQVPPAARCLKNCPLFGETAIALPGSVRTMSFVGPGSEYTYDLVPTGTRYNPIWGNAFLDATSDSTHIYVTSSGIVYAFDHNWGNQELLFTYFNGDLFLGITYDPSNNSLWLSSTYGHTIYDFSMSGELISQFTVPFNNMCGLAMDVDGTLWVSSVGSGTFYHYDRNGNALGSAHYAALENVQTYGGEILQENQAKSAMK
jgi:hypothetical protein